MARIAIATRKEAAYLFPGLNIGRLRKAVIMGSNYFDRRNLYSDDELVACYIKHKSQIKAANELGVSRDTVARAVRRKGIALVGRKYNGKIQSGQKITDEQLRQEAKTSNSREIAIKYGVSEEQVFRRAKKLGIKVQTDNIGGHWYQRSSRYGCAEFDRSISLKKLVERDGGICQICGKAVDYSDIKNGHIRKFYPTLDHIIPLSKGGTHTWNNVQLAHMMCNAGKCDRLSGGVR